MLRRVIDWVTTDWALKVTALALAFLMWVTVRAETPGQWSPGSVPVRVTNSDGNWVLAERPEPSEVTVTFRGPYRELLRLASEGPEFHIPIQEVADSVEFRELRADWLRMPAGTGNTVVGNIQPRTIQLRFDRIATRLIPVAAPLIGVLPAGYELDGPVSVEPVVVRASGASRAITRVDSLRLPPIDMRDRRTYDTLDLTIDTTGTGLILSPRTVRVFVPVRPVGSDTVPSS
ncbi:MAG TPA: CdaR family protein [Longimicrobiales bacterium]